VIRPKRSGRIFEYVAPSLDAGGGDSGWGMMAISAMIGPIVRRAGAMATVLGVALAAVAAGATTAESSHGEIVFDVLRNGSPFGSHRLRFSRDGDRLIVDIGIDLEVRLLVPLYRYTHRSREVWQGGRLIQIDTETDDDGQRFKVAGRATERGFSVDGSSGRFVAPSDVVPTSYWHENMLSRRPWLDSQEGKLIHLEIDTLPRGEATSGPAVLHSAYDITGDLRLRVWYGLAGDWTKLRFQARGSNVEYVLRSTSLSPHLVAPAVKSGGDGPAPISVRAAP